MKTIQKISVIIPFHNEKENLPVLIESLQASLQKNNITNEIILVDDGSLDNYGSSIQHYVDTGFVILLKLNRQMGKGKALAEGIAKSSGDTILFMDADLQDNPENIPAFINKIESGYDFVNGVRHTRKDNLIIKLYSSIASWFLRTYLHSPFSDINCGFKMFRKIVLKDVVLYGNNFRFLPLAVFYEGYRVSEIPVQNKPRIYGKSKYGIGKVFVGGIDMISAYFLYKFAEKPLHFFGGIGAILLGIGGLALAWVTYERLFLGVLLYQRPALQYAIFLIILGIQIIMTGIIGELIVYLHQKRNHN